LALQVLLAEYDGEDKKQFYNKKLNLIRVRTESSTMWIPLFITGTRRYDMDPKKEMVLVVLADPDQSLSDTVDADGNPICTPKAFGIIVQIPPQVRKSFDIPDDTFTSPTKIMSDSSNTSETYSAVGDGDGKLISSEDSVGIKASGGSLFIGKDAIVKSGKMIDMDFFSDSKAGLMKQSWLANIIPTTVVTPFPMYGVDDTILKRIAGLASAVGKVIGGVR